VNAGASRTTAGIVGLWWVALTLAVILIRPATVADETRYLSVAWEMHQSGDFVLLRLNGNLYGHKPPLLFWLIELGWRIFGVQLWWPRLLTGAFGLGALYAVFRLARRLAPGRDDVPALAVMITASSLIWIAFAGAVMFDLALAFFVLLALVNVVRASAGVGFRAWVLVGIAAGLGILVKGPVSLLHVLPVALLGPWWAGEEFRARRLDKKRWYAGVGVAVLVAAGVALAWAIPAAIIGGEAFRTEILWRQSAGRIASEGYHARPFWYHLAVLPLILLPWSASPPCWRGVATALRGRTLLATRFAIAWVVPVFLAFSLMKGKQVHYLLPEVAGFALLAAFGIARAGDRPVRIDKWAAVLAPTLVAAALLALAPRLLSGGVDTTRFASAILLLLAFAVALAVMKLRTPRALVTAAGSACVASAVVLYVLLGPALLRWYDLQNFAGAIAAAQQRGQPVAHLGVYHGEYQFIGRLAAPLHVVHGPRAAVEWARAHPGGALVLRTERPREFAGVQPLASQRYRTGQVFLLRSEDVPAVAEDAMRASPSEPAG
jgi:4-amino-4-deoxy-L-arabinose transferase-like glycosyltransferase